MTPYLSRASLGEHDPYLTLSATGTDTGLIASFSKPSFAEVSTSPVKLGPEVVADATGLSLQTPLSAKVNEPTSDQAPQCAYPSSSPSLTTNDLTASLLGPSRPVGSSAGETPSAPSSTSEPPTRQPRRAAAKLERIAAEKTWEGTRGKGRKDKLTEPEKFSAAIWHVAASKGTAVSLNLGFRRESDHPLVTENRELVHKIGVTNMNVEKRIAGAQLQPTFLMANVEIVATYELYNINRTKLENLIHRIFEPARLEIGIMDRFGRPVVPCEWFLVPLFVIKEAVDKIKDGSISGYRYDPDSAALLKRG